MGRHDVLESCSRGSDLPLRRPARPAVNGEVVFPHRPSFNRVDPLAQALVNQTGLPVLLHPPSLQHTLSGHSLHKLDTRETPNWPTDSAQLEEGTAR